MYGLDITYQRGRLAIVAFITSALMTAAAVTEALGYILFAVQHPGTNFSSFLPITLIGAGPLLVVATLLAIAAYRIWLVDDEAPRFIRQVSGFGLIVLLIGGLWAGLGLAFLGMEDIGTLVFAFRTR